MSTESKDLAVLPPGARSDILRPPPAGGSASALLGAIVPRNFEDAYAMAKMLSRTEMVPKNYRGKPDDIMVAGMWGAELGLSWVQALKSIAVINGNPGLWGDVGKALLLRSGALEDIETTWDAKTRTARCVLKRKGRERPFEAEFSMAMAESVESWEWKNNQRIKTTLAQKDTYKSFPDVMCGWRAFWRAARAGFADLLMGLQGAEEMHDMPPPEPVEAPIRAPRSLAESISQTEVKEPHRSAAPQSPAPTSGNAKPPSSSEDKPTRVDSINPFDYKKQDKSTGTGWTIKLDDGREAGTFSSTVQGKAQRALDEGLPVIVTTEPGKKPGTLRIVELSHHIPDTSAPAADEHGEPEAPES